MRAGTEQNEIESLHYKWEWEWSRKDIGITFGTSAGEGRLHPNHDTKDLAAQKFRIFPTGKYRNVSVFAVFLYKNSTHAICRRKKRHCLPQNIR